MPKASSKAARLQNPSGSRSAHSASRVGGSRSAHSASRIGALIASAHSNSVLTAESRQLLMASHQIPYSRLRPEKVPDAPIFVCLPPEDPTHGGEILGFQSLHRDGISLRFYTSGITNWVCADYVDSSKKPIPKPNFVTIVQLGSPLFPFRVERYNRVQPASVVRPVSNEMHGFQFDGGDHMHLLNPACLHRVIVRGPGGDCQINVMTPHVTIAPPLGFALGVGLHSAHCASRGGANRPARSASRIDALVASTQSDSALTVESYQLLMANHQIPYSRLRPEKVPDAPIFVFLPPEDPTHGGEILGFQSLHRDGISLRFYTSGITNWVCADYVDSSKKPIPKPDFVTIVQLGSPLFPFQTAKYGGMQPASLLRPVSNEMHGFQFEGGDRMHLLNPACLHRVIVHGPGGDCQINVMTPNVTIAPPLGFALGVITDPADLITIGH
ncbi:hypothetical protein BDZ89DRAFT_1071459 [Hymenopellis radicata]|nr:hypothetical protein BDZ89DRAFT_1071459 [Hymenopellis radicata]